MTDLRVGERVRRRAEDRIGDRVARLLPRFAAVDAQRRELAAAGAFGRLFGQRLVVDAAWSFRVVLMLPSSPSIERCPLAILLDCRAQQKTAAPNARQLRLAASKLCERTCDGCSVRNKRQTSRRWLFSRFGCKRPQIPSALNSTRTLRGKQAIPRFRERFFRPGGQASTSWAS